MRKFIITGLFAAVLAACATAAAPAMAHEFVAGQQKGFIQDKGGVQIFEAGGAKVECKEEESKGIVQEKHTATNQEKVTYKKCEAFGAEAVVSQAKYGFKAEGKVAVESEITVKVPAAGCEIKIPAAENQALEKVSYTNLQQNGVIELNAEVKGITGTFSGTGGLCVKGTLHTGTYKGISDVWFFGCDFPVTNGRYADSQCTVAATQSPAWELFLYVIYWR